MVRAELGLTMRSPARFKEPVSNAYRTALWWMHDMMGWGMWMTPWGLIIVVVLVVILIYALAGLAGQRSSESPRGPQVEEKQPLETPLDILKKRYARGEISRDDFEQMKKDLSS